MLVKQKLWTACVTPFNDRKVDFISLEACLRRQEECGNGIIVLGTTGEAISLSDTDKYQILEFVCSLGLRVPILAGVSGYDLSSVLSWLDFCKSMPLAGYLVPTPIYSRPGICGQTSWFEMILSHVGEREVMLYNLPVRSGVSLYPEVLHNLSADSRVVAIKDCSGSPSSVHEYKDAAPNVAVFCGDDVMMTQMRSADGLVSVASNVWPQQTKTYLDHCMLGAGGFPVDIWIKCCSELFSAANPVPIKFLMAKLGLIASDEVRPPLSVRDLPNRTALLDVNELVMRSFSNNANILP